MDAYIYRAAMLCGKCAKLRMSDLEAHPDSDHYPQGPYADGGGESDSPQHCDDCGLFLENPLTCDGIDYVREQFQHSNPMHKSPTLIEWAEFYGAQLCECATISEDADMCVMCSFRQSAV